MQLSDLLALFSYISVYTDCCSQKHHIRTVSAPSNLKTLDQAMHYIADNYTNAITLADVANYLGLTRNYFCRFFKQKTGKTFLGYLSMYRCLKAEDLLRDTDDSIASIALQVGFSSVSYFNKIYKRIRGSTPFEFRKTLA